MTYKVKALEREANGDGWDFDFDGDTYWLPSDFDMRAAMAMTEGDLRGGLRILLGEEQWERLDGSPKVFGLNQLNEMLTQYCEDIGVNLGEWRASSSSSKSTATRSKPTSNGSTRSSSQGSSRTRRR